MGIISLYWIGIIRIMTLLALEYPILKAIMKLKKKGERHFGNHDKYREYLFTIFDNLLDQYKVDLGTFIKYYKISQLIHTQIIAN